MNNNSNQYKPSGQVIRLGDGAYITVIVNGESLTVRESESKVAFDNAIQAFQDKNWEELYRVMRPVKSFAQKIDAVTVDSSGVYFDSRPLHNAIAQRIHEFAVQGLDYKPLCHFLNKLMQNPSKRAVEELYTFLEHKNLPITDNGNFLAYKGLRSNYYSIHGGTQKLIKGKVNSSGQIYNGLGEEIIMERRDVCDDKNVACSTGVHAGSLEYATSFAQGACVIVEINPKDVVSIPSDCNCQKLRTCAYKVVEDYKTPLSKPLYETRWEDDCCGSLCGDCQEDDFDFDSFSPDMYFSTPNSSWLGRVEYHSDREVLKIFALDGTVMVFEGVPMDVFEDYEQHVLDGNSAGQYYHRKIKNVY